jgi:peptidoglycan/xylan/chitin deacetylase (PgdA/CDA1 family)
MRIRCVVGAAGVLAATVTFALGVAPQAAGRAHRDPADASGPLDLRKASVDQVRRSMRLSVRTSRPFHLSALDRHPDTGKRRERFICLQIHRLGHTFMRQLCFGKGPNGDDDTLGFAILNPDKSVRSWEGIDARVERASKRSVVARFNPRAADLRPGKYRWRFVSQWTGPKCLTASREAATPRRRTQPNRCFDRLPNDHDAKFTLHRVQPVGCKDSGPSPRFSGSGDRKRIALTFDDGPSSYTPQILSILRHHHAKGSFFEIGEQVSSASGAVLKAGDELANHSYHHESYPSRSSMAATNSRIRSATGFEPCLFRPPGGFYNSRVVGDAKALGMTTVMWNVDPRDWSNPGSDAIYSRVVSAARPGAIVAMHDGGGDRSQTVAALPRIIKTLHGRGYRLVTVSRLLHQRTIWGEATKPKAPRVPWGFLNSPAGSAPATEKHE